MNTLRARLKAEAYEWALTFAIPTIGGLACSSQIQNLSAPLGEDAASILALVSCIAMAIGLNYLLRFAYGHRIDALNAAADEKAAQR